MTDAIDSTVTLKADVQCILLDCHRDRPWVFAAGVTDELLEALAAHVASKLAPLIGGRYVPQNYARERMEREKRNAAVWEAFASGDSYEQLQRRFKISRRLVYSIIAHKRRAQLPQ